MEGKNKIDVIKLAAVFKYVVSDDNFTKWYNHSLKYFVPCWRVWISWERDGCYPKGLSSDNFEIVENAYKE